MDGATQSQTHEAPEMSARENSSRCSHAEQDRTPQGLTCHPPAREVGPEPSSQAPIVSSTRRTSSSQQHLLPWPSQRDLRRCGLVSFGGHSCSGGPLALTRTRSQPSLSFCDGGAFDFPVAAMRDEYAMLELLHNSTAEPDTPRTAPAAALWAHLRALLQALSGPGPPARPPREEGGVAQRLCTLRSEPLRMSRASGSMPLSPELDCSHSLHSLHTDSDFPLDSHKHCDLLRANPSAPFGRGGDSEAGEARHDSLSTMPSLSAHPCADAPAQGALRAVLLFAASFRRRFSSLGVAAGRGRRSSSGVRGSAEWRRSGSACRGATYAPLHHLSPFVCREVKAPAEFDCV